MCSWRPLDEESIVFDMLDQASSNNQICGALRETGVVVLRNLFDVADLDFLIDNASKRLGSPNIAGAMGYYKVDHPKRGLDPFQIGGGAVRICLDERLIELVEGYMESECILSEAHIKFDRSTSYIYFPIHSDYAAGTKRHARSDVSVTAAMMEAPLGVGAALYMHDCSEGAFCYSFQSHKLGSPHGQNLVDYPDKLRELVLSKTRRIDGMRGDLVLFDDRGFHGPAQPSKADRTVLLLDWINVNVWGAPYQVHPFSVLTTDFGKLSEKQRLVAGIDAIPLAPLEDYHFYQRFKNSKPFAFRMASFIINNAFLLDHLRKVVRTRIRLD